MNYLKFSNYAALHIPMVITLVGSLVILCIDSLYSIIVIIIVVYVVDMDVIVVNIVFNPYLI